MASNNPLNSKVKLASILSLIGGLTTLISTIVGVISILASLGVESIFEKISLPSELKVSIPLYATLASASFAFAAVSFLLLRRGYPKTSAHILLLSSLFGFLSVAAPIAMRLPVRVEVHILAILGSIIVAITGGLAVKLPQKRAPQYMTPLEISLTAVFSALTAIVTGLVGAAFPSPTGGYTHIGDAVIFLTALLFGPKVGFLTGAIGPTIADLAVGYPRWFVTVLAHGAEGLIAGLGKRRPITIQAILCTAAGILMATTYFYINIFIKGYPIAIISLYRDLIGQAGLSLIITLILIKPLEKTIEKLGIT